MTERTDSTGARPGEGVDRRSLLTTFGATAATIMAAGAVATGASLGFSRPVHASTVTDVDILNFGLNLEYVEAEYYSRAFFGTGLMSGHDRRRHARLRSGRLGRALPNPAGRKPRREDRHRRNQSCPLPAPQSRSLAVARPNIDLLNSFNALAALAGLVSSGTHFNPFLNETNFLLGAFVFEDVGVTAYADAAALISNPAYLSAAASILAIEAYNGGAIRTALSYLGQQSAANAISGVRATLGGGNEQGLATTNPTVAINISPSNTESLAFRRTTTQVLNVVYGGVTTGGGFLPNQMNGTTC